MRALIQRVSSGSVAISGKTAGKIGRGLVILLGITHKDTEDEVKYLAEKCVNLRIFCDEAGKMNLSLHDIAGEALIISQFTLYGDAAKGRRPGFSEAARPEHAIPLYESFIKAVRNRDIKVATGEFGASMLVDIKNDGPVTLMLESK
ncbi:MAG: D-aminoacyl-tRNA deacylase [Victivallaceae bacterium]|nr:D-aminoacyl-tRNA deacylase [Victivallaceae bacterium]